MSGPEEIDAGSPEKQAKQGTEESFATAKLRADVARQQMRLAKDQLKRARKRFKEARREARRARKLALVARRAWKKSKRRSTSGRGNSGDETRKVAAKLGRRPSARRSRGRPAVRQGGNGATAKVARKQGKARRPSRRGPAGRTTGGASAARRRR